MINYEVDPSLLRVRVPPGTMLDDWNGRCFVSVVGFQFLDTRILGLPVPLHRDFVEVNLRFYVRRIVNGETRRGVVFVKEIVPHRAIAWVANTVYNEHYVAMPMSSETSRDRVAYTWTHRGRLSRLGVSFDGDPSCPMNDSEEAFITEHYWGYARQRDGSTMEYQVEHPRWAVWRGKASALDCDVTALYGPDFVTALSGRPSSAFLADGSEVIVRSGVRLETLRATDGSRA